MHRPPSGRTAGNGSVPRRMESKGLVGMRFVITVLFSMRRILGIDLANPSSPSGSAPFSGSFVGRGRLVSGGGSSSSGLCRLPPGPSTNCGGGSAQPTYLDALGAVGPSGFSPGAGNGWQGGHASGQGDPPVGHRGVKRLLVWVDPTTPAKPARSDKRHIKVGAHRQGSGGQMSKT